MTFEGTVINGAIVLEGGTPLSEGTRVQVEVAGTVLSLPGGRKTQSVLDIPPVSLGAVLAPVTAEDDLLGEMLEGRP